MKVDLLKAEEEIKKKIQAATAVLANI